MGVPCLAGDLTLSLPPCYRHALGASVCRSDRPEGMCRIYPGAIRRRLHGIAGSLYLLRSLSRRCKLLLVRGTFLLQDVPCLGCSALATASWETLSTRPLVW